MQNGWGLHKLWKSMYIKHISVNTLLLKLIEVEKQGKTLWVAGLRLVLERQDESGEFEEGFGAQSKWSGEGERGAHVHIMWVLNAQLLLKYDRFLGWVCVAAVWSVVLNLCSVLLQLWLFSWFYLMLMWIGGDSKCGLHFFVWVCVFSMIWNWDLTEVCISFPNSVITTWLKISAAVLVVQLTVP